MRTVRFGPIFIAALFLFSGCAAQRYEWNQYDQRLYDYYKDPGSGEAFVKAMTIHVQALEAAGKKPAPGLYAELGTFALSSGDSKQAITYYSKEMKAWPESSSLMAALIASIEKRNGGVAK